ncbi:winged helix-turn-helix domain-containing protein [Klebsiella aerogenes]|uniref:winged helix-turn-helix domain-containing protein n=1 Tax=Klebsiella aerogenes TaxID=548 RepID=UPI0013A6769B|nr:winged helix-turn-helix domain-containing protein [Klebsiella aerogenes]HCB2864788.1 winged helix-turn-helix domain-containing protein [Klebsiella aerogenes]HCB2881614.1 winged helix-turn-helix domain-containing protein [Klebsiella aerogenes]HCB3345851.1 winged helix-turn-helix domain-containing protein [Klebsiella aerogenes]HCM1812519.1 winged helix-turn-helix domain-containing protein [Klebsiella aerogenes]
MTYIERRWVIRFSIPGMNKSLHSQGLCIKVSTGTQHKFRDEKQQLFIDNQSDVIFAGIAWKKTSTYAYLLWPD